MTGRDLIIYILANNLEDEPVFNDNKFLGFMSVDEAAAKLDVGPETIRLYAFMGWIDSVQIGEMLYIPANLEFYGRKE